MVNEIPFRIEWGTVIWSISVMVAAYLLAKLLSYSMTKLSNRTVERRITIKMVIPLFKIGIYGFAIYYVLVSIIQLSSTQVLAVSGLIGAGIGFGLKDLVANFIGGMVLIIERPYKVGDKITLGDHYGEVIDIGLRSTKLQTPDDSRISVPNYHAIVEAVSNANTGSPEMLVSIAFTVDKQADLTEVRDIVEEGIITSEYVYMSDDLPYDVQIEESEQAIEIEGRAYVNDHRNELAFISDVTHRVSKAFEEAGIPRPQYRRITDDSRGL